MEGQGEAMTGLVIRVGDRPFFRGGLYWGESTFWLYEEDGPVAGRGGTTGRAIGPNEIFVEDITPAFLVRLTRAPVLTHKGAWSIWYLATLAAALGVFCILNADRVAEMGRTRSVRGMSGVVLSLWLLLCIAMLAVSLWAYYWGLVV